MSIEVIKNHFLNIGKSYYNSAEFLLQDIAYKPIGNYGIGFLACFMLSDNIKVITRYYNNPEKYIIDLEKGNEFTSMLKSNDVRFEGTEVIFQYKKFMSVFKDKVENISEFLTKFFITDGLELELIDVSEKKKIQIVNTINKSVKPEKGYVIHLDEYLNEIEGYAIVKHRDSFIHGIVDIPFDGELYLYEYEKGLNHIDDLSTINIDDFISKNQINYLNIPLVERRNSTDYLNGVSGNYKCKKMVNKNARFSTFLISEIGSAKE